MPALVTIGRVLFVLLFVFSGVSKLFDITGTAAQITAKIVPAIPAVAAPYVMQIEAVTGMQIAELLAILSGLLEAGGGLLIALNIGARFFAWLLIFYTVATVYFFHDFWNMAGADKAGNMIHALKNLSIIGGLLIIAGYPRGGLAEGQYASSNDTRY